MKIEQNLSNEIITLLKSGAPVNKIFINLKDRWGISTHADTWAGWTRLYGELSSQDPAERKDEAEIREEMLNELVVLGDYFGDYNFHALLAEAGTGLHYESAEWKELADQSGMFGWENLWPVVDLKGNLTGSITEDRIRNYALVDQSVAYELRLGERKFVSRDGYIDLTQLTAE